MFSITEIGLSKYFKPVIILGLFVSIIFIQIKITHISRVSTDELLYLPNEKLLRHFTAGLDTIIADLLWIRCLLYVGSELHGKFEFEWLEKMLNAVVQLDPYFREAYRYGSIFLSALRADSEPALELLHRGMYYRPDAWDLPYEAGMIHMINKAKMPNSKKIAGIYLAMSARTGKAPQFVVSLAEKLSSEYDLLEIEEDMWMNLAKSDDQLLKDIAERKLVLVKIKRACGELNRRLEQYKMRYNKLPDNLLELGLKPEHVVDPLGGKFFISKLGKVENTSVLDDILENNKHLIENGIRAFHEKLNRYPFSLQELIDTKVVTYLPEMPYDDREWVYDPHTGSISWKKVPNF